MRQVAVNTRVDLHNLAGSLHCDQRGQGNHGRTVSVAMPSLGLLEGDRLEPRANPLDVGQLESMTKCPLWLTFWRQANETSARHRSPPFPRETHISPCSIALDSLHCSHLGVYKDCCMTALWECILADAWKLGTSTQDEVVHMSVLHCKEALQAWYRTQHSQHPSVPLHKLQDLRPWMLGNHLHQKLGTDAAETGTFLECAKDLAKQHVACLGAEVPAPVAGSDALVNMRDVMRANPKGDAACSSGRTCGPSETSLRPAPSRRHPWPTQVAPRAAHRCQSWLLGKSTVPHHFPGRRLERRSGEAGRRMPSRDVARVLASFRHAYSFSDHRVRRRRHE